MTRRLLLGAAICLLLAACDRTTRGGVDPTAATTVDPATWTGLPAASEPQWWNDCVFYEVFVRSFRDSDGDGVGDLRGLIERLDYLNDGDPATRTDLGVTGIWLMPVAESPSYHGYDVVNYTLVDPEYGTNEDFLELMAACRARGIRVIVDFVVNHTSSRHPWFVSASADRMSPYRDFYVWKDKAPSWERPWGGSPWHRTPTGSYYGIFTGGMPDLNYRNPRVTDEIFAAAAFWLRDLGVDGFRLDAVKHLIEDGSVQENTPGSRGWLRGFRKFTKETKADALTVGEVWSASHEIARYIGEGGLDIAFEFGAAGAMVGSARNESRHAAADAHRVLAGLYPAGQVAPFLTNHDQERVMTALGGNTNHAASAASLLLTGPGVPFLYYGEEIGQRGGKPDENIRTPMQWDDTPNAGFSAGAAAWRAPQPDYPTVNVARQTQDDGSLLAHYRRLIHARNAHPALRTGTLRDVPAGDPRIYAFLREAPGETLLVVINLSGAPVEDYALRWTPGAALPTRAEEVLGGGPAAPLPPADPTGEVVYRPLAVLPPYTTWILRLE